jgi:hypothetical protein
MATLDVKRPRPRQLSNPDGEFGPDTIAEILDAPDAHLQWRHFQSLLGPYFTAGTYEEVLYFLPKAFDYILAHDDDSLELVTSLIWFVSIFDEQLRHERLRNATRDRLRDCLSHWTAEFTVVHFDLDACRQKGWGIAYDDCVKNCEVICEGTCDLVRFKQHADLAVEFVQSLAYHAGNDVKAAWFLEYSRSRFDVYTPPDDAQIRELLMDRELLESAAEVVRKQRVVSDPSPTYWRDTFFELGMY